MNGERTDPRRIAVLALMIGGAVVYAWLRSADGAGDVLRFLAGAGAGLALAGLTRAGDRGLAGTMSYRRRVALARKLVVFGAATGAACIIPLRGLDLDATLEVVLAGAFAGFFAGVGVLYPLEA